MAASNGNRLQHPVQFYETEPFLHRAIADFFADGADADEPLVMLARPRTFEALAGHFASDSIRFFDADETLAEIMDGDVLHPTRCDQTLGRLVSEVTSSGEQRTMRVYGELVDLLCQRGNHAAAIRLEAWWNDTIARHPGFSLCCGYDIERFDAGPASASLVQLCQQHTEVLPTERFAEVAVDGQFERAVLLQHRSRTSTVYVVDDDASVRRSLARLFTSLQFEVRTFESAEAFLAEVGHLPNGCLVLDVQLPGMSAPELQSRLGAVRGRLPVIAMSGSHDPQLEVEMLRLGASVFLPKPFEAHALLDAIAWAQFWRDRPTFLLPARRPQTTSSRSARLSVSISGGWPSSDARTERSTRHTRAPPFARSLSRRQLRWGQRVRGRRRRHPVEQELLCAVARSDLRHVEVALRIDRDMMRPLKVTGLGTSLPN